MQVDTYYYTTPSGKNPVKEFIIKQNEETQEKILEKIRQLNKYGFQLSKSDLKKISSTKNLWELRIKTKSGIYRLFIAKLGKKTVIILLHAIHKKTQKTPQKDIKIALKRLQILKKQGIIWQK